MSFNSKFLPLNSIVIDKSNGSVYLNVFSFNITSLDQLLRFRGSFQLILGARDLAPTNSLSALPLNITLYLNYDLSELSADYQAGTTLRSPGHDIDEFGLLTLDSEFESHSHSKSHFQLISNGVLLIILITVLVFMMIVACFLFIIFYKKNIWVETESKEKLDKEPNGTPKIDLNANKNERKKSTQRSYLELVKSGIKFNCNFINSNSLVDNRDSIISKDKEENLTVTIFSQNKKSIEY